MSHHTKTYLKALEQLGRPLKEFIPTPDSGTKCKTCRTAFMPHPEKPSDICGLCKLKAREV